MRLLVTLTITTFFLTANPTATAETKIAAHFRDLDGCFILYDLKNNNEVVRWGGARCSQPMPACSTFKVALALMGFDAGVLKDENTPFKWDGTHQPIETWNRDQTAASWISESVVWVSQQIVQKLGSDRVQKYLDQFQYGTRDLSGGLTTAWLTSNRWTKHNPTLKISAAEQVSFFARLWREQLQVSPRATELTKKVSFVETSPNGYALHGKTGSGFVGTKRLGWFVAHLRGHSNEYVAAVTFTDRDAHQSRYPYAGLEARQILKDILIERGLW